MDRILILVGPYCCEIWGSHVFTVCCDIMPYTLVKVS
jgi:hypothetical protein